MVTASETILELREIHVVKGGARILQNLSWTVRRGEHWALIGANGSGKTSALRIVSGNDWPTSGAVAVLGERFGSVNLRELRKRIGWVSSAAQERLPDEDTALQVAVSGQFAAYSLDFDTPPPEAWGRAREELAGVGCAALAERKYGTLSQGERQKVMIARALMARPQLLILDEPCTGLDPASRESLLETLQRLGENPAGPTLIFVTHHIEEIFPAVTRVLALKGGRAAACGAKEEVLTGATLSEIFSLPLAVETTHCRYWPRVIHP